MPNFYIGYIDIPPAIEVKIRSTHGVTPEEVRELYARVVPGRWDDHPERGRRLYVVFRTSGGRTLKIVLQPIDPSDGTWRLRTAIVATRV